MLCTGARILLESLKREGVDLFFGYPGGAVIDIYDELSNHPDLRHILVRHEQGAVHAADGFHEAVCRRVVFQNVNQDDRDPDDAHEQIAAAFGAEFQDEHELHAHQQQTRRLART